MATLLESLGLTPQHYQNIAEMQKDPASYGGTQAGYAIKSAKDLVSQSKNPLATYMGQTFGSPIYDFSQALGKYSDKGYQGEFSLTPRGAVDFGKNLLSVGKEFLDQKPIAMMAGRTLGGIKGLGDWAYENLEPATQFGDWTGGGIYNLIHGTDDGEKGTIIPNLKRKIMMDQRATQKGIAQVAMQKRIQEEERQRAAAEAAAAQAAAALAAAAQQVRQNIQTYGNRDRPNTGMNRPGGGRGQSPTGGDVAGTPFYRGGIVSML